MEPSVHCCHYCIVPIVLLGEGPAPLRQQANIDISKYFFCTIFTFCRFIESMTYILQICSKLRYVATFIFSFIFFNCSRRIDEGVIALISQLAVLFFFKTKPIFWGELFRRLIAQELSKNLFGKLFIWEICQIQNDFNDFVFEYINAQNLTQKWRNLFVFLG